MFLKPLSKRLKAATSGLLIALASLVHAKAGAALDQASIDHAIQYFGVLRGEAVASDDAAWLKQRWTEEARLSPQTIAAEVDNLALAFERHQKKPDPLILANQRMNLLKDVYCTAKQTSDPAMQRLKDILAPDDVVLAADCILGLVVTRFDVDGAVASHAMTAAATGQSHNADKDRAEIIKIIQDGFADATPADKALVARAELRHAMLARFWSRIDGTPEQSAVVDGISSAAADLRVLARELENLAASKLGDVDYLAKVGDARLTAGMIGTYSEWLERIAGYSFSRRDRAWMEEVIISDFRDDPAKLMGDVANVETLNRAYRTGDSPEEQAAMLAGWAADLHCYLNASEDPNEIRLAKVVFRNDPVTSADCDARRIARKSETVLAESGGQQLTESDLNVSRRFASIMLGRPLLPEEEEVIRKDNIQNFTKDLNSWSENFAFYQAFLGKVDKYQHDIFLAMDERKKLFDPIYCALKASSEPFAADYVKMFQRGGGILFEDCEQQLVTTEDEVEALASVLNFLALLNDMPPLSEAEHEELRKAYASENMNRAESMRLALNEWWSLLTLDEKVAEVLKMRQNGIKPGADGETLRSFINTVELTVVAMNARNQSCKMLAVTIQGMTAIYGASIGPNAVTGNNPSGIPGEQLGGLVAATNAAREICRGIMGG